MKDIVDRIKDKTFIKYCCTSTNDKIVEMTDLMNDISADIDNVGKICL